MKKTVLGLILALVLLASLALPALAEADLTQGVYEVAWTPEGYSEYYNYIHFYASGVFYLSTYNGGQYAAGFYELKDMQLEYMPDKEFPDVKATADQAIVFTAPDGSEMFTLAYANDTVYNLPTLFDRNFAHNPEASNDPANETGVALTEFVNPDDEYGLLRFMHNGTFQDTVGMMVEGTWTKDGSVYTMTDDDSGDSYTLTLSDDGNTGLYLGLDGEEITLDLIKAAEVMLLFRGKAAAAYGEMSVEIACLDGGACEMTVYYAGTENKSTGEWQLASNMGSVSLTIGGVDYTAAIDMSDYSFGFELTNSDGVGEVTIPLTTKEEVTLKYTFVGENNDKVVMECYSDGTCAVIYTGMGAVTTGTWAMDTSSALPKWTVELADVFEGQDLTVSTDYQTKFFFTYKNSSGQLTETLALPFSALQ